MTLTAAGAAWACDGAKTASASSAQECAAKAKMAAADAKCSAKMASADIKCAEKMAAAHKDCDYCCLVADLKASKGKFTVSTVESKDGITVVFAAVNHHAVEATQAMANRAFKLMSAPAHCSYTRAKMAEGSCHDCKESLGAFADAEVSFENTKNGALTKVVTADKKEMQKLHKFFATFNTEETKTEG